MSKLRNFGMGMVVVTLILISAIVITAGCVNNSENPTPVSGVVSHSDITKVTDYLYEVTYYDYDETKMMENAKHLENLINKTGNPPAGCSSAHNGDYYGRNFDYIYSDMSEFIMHVPASEKRYASVGVAAIWVGWTPEYIEAGMPDEDLALLPFCILDGINENGVGVNTNVVPVNDLEIVTSGTNPGKTDLPLLFAPRYVLDHAASAKEAVDLLSKCNLIATKFCSDTTYELHIMICDPTESYIVECVNNKMQVVKDDVMTNYYLTLDSYTPHSQGIERYNILTEHIAEGDSVDGMDHLMQRVQYTKTYNPENTPRWFSEVCDTVTLDRPIEEKERELNSLSAQAQKTSRTPKNAIWQTTHSSIYDLKNLTMRVHVQEDYEHSYEYHL